MLKIRLWAGITYFLDILSCNIMDTITPKIQFPKFNGPDAIDDKDAYIKKCMAAFSTLKNSGELEWYLEDVRDFASKHLDMSIEQFFSACKEQLSK